MRGLCAFVRPSRQQEKSVSVWGRHRTHRKDCLAQEETEFEDNMQRGQCYNARKGQNQDLNPNLSSEVHPELLCLLGLSEGLKRTQTSPTVSFIAHNQTYGQNYKQLIKL